MFKFAGISRVLNKSLIKSGIFNTNTSHSSRSFYMWINTIFNKVDAQRIEDVGPNRAAAEWLLRCGASIKWKNTENWYSDYNDLQTHLTTNVIEEIDATESCVMHVGFPYLSGLKDLKRIKFRKCIYLDDACMDLLKVTKESLQHLEVVSCGNVTDKGILSLSELKNLQDLYLFDLPEVKDPKNCVQTLEKSLPECDVNFPLPTK